MGTRNERQHRDADIYQAKLTANAGGFGARAEGWLSRLGEVHDDGGQW